MLKTLKGLCLPQLYLKAITERCTNLAEAPLTQFSTRKGNGKFEFGRCLLMSRFIRCFGLQINN